jgi:hypothetical protein
MAAPKLRWETQRWTTLARTKTRSHNSDLAKEPRKSQIVFHKNEQDSHITTEVTALPPSFDYWNTKIGSWLTLSNLGNAKWK